MNFAVLKGKTGLIISAGTSAFLVYFCMYAFRKPFSVGVFEGHELFGMDYKIVLIIAQVIGYATSKIIGIKVISELQKNYRPWLILGLLAVAELALLGFALVPTPYNVAFLFLNGLPLGMIWGVVFSYLEGRTVTELLAAMLSASFVMASGVTKAVGKYLMLEFGITEFWMPVATGAVFILPLLFSVWWMEQLPPPTEEDIGQRHKREAMTGTDRGKLFFHLWPGLIAIVGMYFFLTAFRDYRDNFSAEVWLELGMGDRADVFATTETAIAIVSLMVMALFVFIRRNEVAL